MIEVFQKLTDEYADQHRFSGTCMLKSADEVLFAGAYGYANRAFKVKNKLDTRFDAASVTKTFTAAAILQLIDKGLLNLDSRIHDFVDLAGTKIPEDVRIEQLLNHTSGIADDADEEAGEDYSLLFLASPNYAIRNCRDFLPNFVYKEPYFRAGTNMRYNNCAFILLGLVIEAITKQNYREYVEQNIFEKAGMKNTKFSAMDEICENTAEGYGDVFLHNKSGEEIWYGFKKNIYSYPPVGSADSGAYTTVEDLDRFLRSVKANILLSPDYSKMILQPHCNFTKKSQWNAVTDTRVRMGYAFEFLEIKNELFCIYKEGINEGVSAMFSYYPKADLTLSILSNQNCDVWKMHRDMQTEIYHRFYHA